VRLEFTQPFGADHFQTLDSVGLAALKEILEPWQLTFGDRDDHLATAIGRDALLLAIGVQLALSLDAEARLERPGRIVNAGVQHAAVVSGLVKAYARLFVEDR